MPIQVNFDTVDLNATEASALVAFLVALCPDAANHQSGNVTITGEGLTMSASPEVIARVMANGSPVEITDPAVAFGGAPVAPLAGSAANGAPAPVASVQSSPTDTTALAQSAPLAATSSPSEAPPPPPPGVIVDRTGLPWDGRIHSTPEKLNVDGSWRAKRNVLAQTVKDVEAELRAVMAAPAPLAPANTATAGAPPAPPAPDMSGSANGASGASVVPPAPSPNASSGPAAVPLPPAAIEAAQQAALAEAALPAPLSPAAMFANLMRNTVTPGQTAGKITTETINAICTGFGLPYIGALVQRPDLLPQVETAINQAIAAAG